MAELTLPVLIAVFEEVFGPLIFWGLVGLSVGVTVAFLWLIIRDRGLKGSVVLRAELWAPVGAAGAVLLVQHVTDSSFASVGGPVDVVVLLVVAVVGAVGLTILAYVVAALSGGGD